MLELLSYEFIHNALLVAFLTSVLCGIVGPFVVTKRLVFMSEGISHMNFGGIGLAYLFGVEHLFLGALAFSVIVSFILANIEESISHRKDSLIGILCALGMSVGTLCIYQKSGYTPDLIHFLFGNIFNISNEDVWMIAIVVFLIVLLVLLFFREFVILSFDHTLMKLKGMRVAFFQSIFYLTIAVTVTILIRIIGTMLSTTFLTLSVNIALLYVHSIKSVMVVSICMNMVFIVVGFLISYYVDIPSGPAIFLFGIVILLICHVYNFLKRKYLQL